MKSASILGMITRVTIAGYLNLQTLTDVPPTNTDGNLDRYEIAERIYLIQLYDSPVFQSSSCILYDPAVLSTCLYRVANIVQVLREETLER